MSANQLLIRLNKTSGGNHDLQTDGSIPLRVDMSTLEAEQIGKLFSLGSQDFQIYGNALHNKIFEGVFDIKKDGAYSMYNSEPVSVILNGDVI